MEKTVKQVKCFDSQKKHIIKFFQKAEKKLKQLITEVQESTNENFLQTIIEIELPVVTNYLAEGTKSAMFENPGKIALNVLPNYWKDSLNFPTSTHSLGEVWKSVWKCNMTREEILLLKKIPIIPQNNKYQRKWMPTSEIFNIPNSENIQAEPIEYVDDGEILSVSFILDRVYQNLESGVKFAPNLPGYTSDVYIKMKREKLENDFLNQFKIETFDGMIADAGLVEYMSTTIKREVQEEYNRILLNAKWQGPFFYGGSNKDQFGYFSFATISPEEEFGGWWIVFWKNGTIRISQNMSINQVGKVVNLF